MRSTNSAQAGKIYTKKGDKGKTSLFDGKKVSKASIKVETYASIDELNASLGVVAAFIKDRKINNEIEKIQNDLLEIGSSLAVSKTRKVSRLKDRSQDFEILINKLTKKLPPLNQFILPGGGKGGALLHVSRTLTRRSERRVVELSKKEKIDPITIKYLNRLSDLLFTMARYVNFQEKPYGKLRASEKIWRKK